MCFCKCRNKVFQKFQTKPIIVAGELLDKSKDEDAALKLNKIRKELNNKG